MMTSKIKSPYLRHRARQKALQASRQKQARIYSSTVSPITAIGLIMAVHDIVNNEGRGMKKLAGFFVEKLITRPTNN